MMMRMSLLLICLVCGISVPLDSPNKLCPHCGGVCTRKHTHQHEVAQHLGISPCLLSKWNREADKLNDQEKHQGTMLKVHRGPRRQYADEEEALWMSFVNMRVNLGYPVDHFWIKKEMSNLLATTRGEEGVVLSNGWLGSWKNHYRVSEQVKTEKKYKSAVERLATVDEFHRDLKVLQRIMPQVSPTWGAYAPTNIWNADHVPLPFIINFKRSLNPIGKDCWIAQMGASGLDKRQATIHLW